MYLLKDLWSLLARVFNSLYTCLSNTTETEICHIVDVCLGKRKRAGGYAWEYINKN